MAKSNFAFPRYLSGASSSTEFGFPQITYNALQPNFPDQYLPAINYGYFGGGLDTSISPQSTSKVGRINYSNDTSTALVKGPLSNSGYYLAATGNSSYCYFGGGFPGPQTTVNRLDYNNDSE